MEDHRGRFARRAAHSRQETHDPKKAVRSAFQEIEKQLENYKASLQGEERWKRVERRRELKLRRAGVAPAAGDEEPQWFFKLVEPRLPRLREVAGSGDILSMLVRFALEEIKAEVKRAEADRRHVRPPGRGYSGNPAHRRGLDAGRRDSGLLSAG